MLERITILKMHGDDRDLQDCLVVSGLPRPVSELSRFLHQRQQEMSQEKVSQVVRPHSHLEAVLGLGVGTVADPGVVDEDVDPVDLGLESLRASADRGQTAQVELFPVDFEARVPLLDLPDRGYRLLLVAVKHDDAGAAGGQILDCEAADAGIGTLNK